MIEFEVHIDESGLFVETSSELADKKMANGQDRKFASQLAGLLFPKTKFDEKTAESVIKKCCKKAKVEFSHQLHCNKIHPPQTFSDFVTEGCINFHKHGLQPFRIVNEEQVNFGDRVSNYTNILAELLLRICHELSKEGHESIALSVHAARVWLKEGETGERKFIEQADYLLRINEYFARAAIRKGYGAQTKNWKVKSFRLGSGQDHKILQLCDLVSNASHDNFVKCDEVAKSRLQSLLGDFDFTLSSDTFYDEVNEFVSLNSYGLAFVSMAQRAADGLATDDLFSSKLEDVTARFSKASASVKLPQLQILLAWLQQATESRKDLHFSLRAIEWVRDTLVPSIQEQDSGDESIGDWLTFTTTSILITTHNHLGQTIEANKASNSLDTLIPKLAGRWEYSSDIFDALIARAVHQNDCFEHETARDGMDSVIGFFSNLAGFFSDAFPDVFPKEVKSVLRAKALGTKVQSEIFLLLQDATEIGIARQTSDAAIDQFELPDHKCRQYQFRSEIEAIDGNWSEARRYVAMSLGIEEPSHDAIACRIAGLELEQQGFPLLHWTRLGGMAASVGDRDELKEFITALKAHKLTNNQWIIGTASNEYPAHGILRRMAVVKAFNGDQTGMVSAISRLRNIIGESDAFHPVFEAILAATLVQVSAIVFKPEKNTGLEYLDKKHNSKPGAKQFVERLIKRTEKSHPAMSKMLCGWNEQIEEVLAGKLEPGKLSLVGRQVGY